MVGSKLVGSGGPSLHHGNNVQTPGAKSQKKLANSRRLESKRKLEMTYLCTKDKRAESTFVCYTREYTQQLKRTGYI